MEKVGFGLREENWYLEIWGGVFWKRLDLDSGKKSLEIWGVFWKWSDLDLGKKTGIWKLEGGVLEKVRFGLREENWYLEIWGGCSEVVKS